MVGPLTYKASPSGTSLTDRAMRQALTDAGVPWREQRYDPTRGSDERQYGAPAPRWPIGSLMSPPYAEFPAYHTNADTYLDWAALGRTVGLYLDALEMIEGTRRWWSGVAFGEPQLGRRGLYDPVGGGAPNAGDTAALLWAANLADGEDTLAMAARAGLPWTVMDRACQRLAAAEVLKPSHDPPTEGQEL